MTSKKSPKPETETAKPEEKIKAELEQARAETKAALALIKDEEEARRKVEAALTEAEKVVATAKTDQQKEQQIRKKAEETLAHTQEKLSAAWSEVEKEHQARLRAEKNVAEAEKALAKAKQGVGTEADSTEHSSTGSGERSGVKPVSFVVRVTVDEHGQPQQTVIMHHQSGQSDPFSGLDMQRLAAFIKAHLSSPAMPETATPSASPSATVEAPPASSEVTAKLTITSAERVRTGYADGMILIMNPNESFGVQTCFIIEAPEAASVTDQEGRYEVRIQARDVLKGTTLSLATHQGKVVKNALKYTDYVQVPGLPSGLYRLITLIDLQTSSIKLAGHHEGLVFQVGEVQPVLSPTASQEATQPQ